LHEGPGNDEELVRGFPQFFHCNYGTTLTISFFGDMTLRRWIIDDEESLLSRKVVMVLTIVAYISRKNGIFSYTVAKALKLV